MDVSRIEKINIIKKQLGNEIIIGSFQKDSINGEPKLSKGPDVFFEIIKKLNDYYNIKVILSASNRDFLINNFKKHNIKYIYFENYENINDLYDVCNWYFVTSRIEGGPQSILESSYRKVKILSTDVGLAKDVLHSECICKDVNEFIEKFSKGINYLDYNFQNVKNYLPNIIIPKLDYFFEHLI